MKRIVVCLCCIIHTLFCYSQEPGVNSSGEKSPSFSNQSGTVIISYGPVYYQEPKDKLEKPNVSIDELFAVNQILEKRLNEITDSWGGYFERMITVRKKLDTLYWNQDYWNVAELLDTIEKYQSELLLATLEEKAWNYFYLNQADSAVKIFDKALTLDPRSFEIWLAKGFSSQRQMNLKEAIFCYQKAIKFAENDTLASYAYIGLADIYQARKEFSKAIYYFDRASNFNRDSLILLAMIAEIKGNYSQAEEYCEELLLKDSLNYPAWLLLSRIYMNSFRPKEAEYCVNKMLEMEPDDSFALIAKSDLLHKNNAPIQAKNSLQRALEVTPNWLQKAVMSYSEGDLKGALRDLEEGTQKDSTNAWLQFIKGKMLEDFQQFEESEKCYDNAIKIDSTLTIAWDAKGHLNMHQEDFMTAIYCYTKTTELDPTPIRWISKGDTYFFKGDYGEANKCYRTALRLDSTYINGWLGILDVYEEEKNYDALLHASNKILEFQPKNVRGLKNKAYALNYLNQPREALKYYYQALELEPNNIFTLNSIGNILTYYGDPDTAISILNRVILINKDFAITWNNKGQALKKMYRYEEAEIAFRNAVSIDPSNDFYWEKRMENAKTLENFDTALVCANKLIELGENNSAIWDDKGYFLLRLHKPNEAIPAYKKAIEISPKNAGHWSGIGLAFAMKEDYKKALKNFEMALSYDSTAYHSWYGKGFALMNSKKEIKLLEANECFKKAIRLGEGKGAPINDYRACQQITIDKLVKLDTAYANLYEEMIVKPRGIMPGETSRPTYFGSGDIPETSPIPTDELPADKVLEPKEDGVRKTETGSIQNFNSEEIETVGPKNSNP